MSNETDNNVLKFHMQEHSLLRSRMDEQVQAIHSLERYTLAGMAILFSWLTVNHHDLGKGYQFVWFLPPVLCGLAWIRSVALGRRVGLLARYLQEVEAGLPKLSSLCGWETYLHKNKPGTLRISRTLFWSALLTLTITFSIYSIFAHKQHCKQNSGECKHSENPSTPEEKDGIKMK